MRVSVDDTEELGITTNPIDVGPKYTVTQPRKRITEKKTEHSSFTPSDEDNLYSVEDFEIDPR